MSERNQEESPLSIWAGAQQKALAGWLDFIQETPKTSRTVAWTETIKAWQIAIQETLGAQARWLRDWTGRVQVTSGSPTELRKNVQEAQTLLLRWNEAQMLLWQRWFDLVQHLGPLLEADPLNDEHLLSRMRESGQEIVNAQEEWMRRWTANLLDQ